MSTAYIPGSCNLGKAEVRRRQFVALIGLRLSITTFVGLIGSDAPASARWAMFAPLMFCLAYGFMGTFNLGKLGDLSRVQNPEDRKADRKTALGILIQAAALALVLTLIIVFLPF